MIDIKDLIIEAIAREPKPIMIIAKTPEGISQLMIDNIRLELSKLDVGEIPFVIVPFGFTLEAILDPRLAELKKENAELNERIKQMESDAWERGTYD